jgi:hypothetical protein
MASYHLAEQEAYMHYLFGVAEDGWFGAIDVCTVSKALFQANQAVLCFLPSCAVYQVLSLGMAILMSSHQHASRRPRAFLYVNIMRLNVDVARSTACGSSPQGTSHLFCPRLPEAYAVWMGPLKKPVDYQAM